MRFDVLMAEDAVRDIEEIYRYVARNDAVEKADLLIDALEAACGSLADFPERGNIPKELASLGSANTASCTTSPIGSSTGLSAGK